MARLALVHSVSSVSDAETDRRALAILVVATGAVVGEVSKTYQVMERAVSDVDGDIAAAMRAFNDLPGWQRQRIAELAALTARQVEQI